MQNQEPIPPKSMREALDRKRILARDIMFIERQLADEVRFDKHHRRLSPAEYAHWRGDAHTSLVFKKTEHAYLKDWIVNRRREIQAEEMNCFDPNDPRSLLVMARDAILQARRGDDSDLGVCFDVIEQYLQHAA